MQLEDIMLNEVSQAQKDKGHLLDRYKTYTYTQKQA
jgi:hypothetical protein